MQQTGGQISPDGYWMWNGTQWVPNPYRAVAAPVFIPYESGRYRANVASILVASNVLGVVLITATNLTIDLMPNPNDQQSLVIGAMALISLPVFYGTLIGAAVCYAMWLHRVIRNMPALGSPDPRWTPARAVTYCFIPIATLFFPVWAVLDAWRGGDASRRWLDRNARRTLRAPALITGWWSAWLIGGYALNIGSRVTGSGGAFFDLLGALGLCVAAWLCILVIRDVTARQERKNGLIAAGQLA